MPSHRQSLSSTNMPTTKFHSPLMTIGPSMHCLLFRWIGVVQKPAQRCIIFLADTNPSAPWLASNCSCRFACWWRQSSRSRSTPLLCCRWSHWFCEKNSFGRFWNFFCMAAARHKQFSRATNNRTLVLHTPQRIWAFAKPKMLTLETLLAAIETQLTHTPPRLLRQQAIQTRWIRRCLCEATQLPGCVRIHASQHPVVHVSLPCLNRSRPQVHQLLRGIYLGVVARLALEMGFRPLPQATKVNNATIPNLFAPGATAFKNVYPKREFTVLREAQTEISKNVQESFVHKNVCLSKLRTTLGVHPKSTESTSD